MGIDDEEEPGTSIIDKAVVRDRDCRENMYKVLGHDIFLDVKKVHVVPKWISGGETFASELRSEGCADLNVIKSLHPLLLDRIKEHLKQWYPVQHATLPYLVAATNACSILPPRDLVISAPTGSGKTLCYVIPILNALRTISAMDHSIFALIIAPVQNLVEQIEKACALLFSYIGAIMTMEFKKYNVFNVPIVSLCGNHDINAERYQLKNAKIAIATPGRLMEHITNMDFHVNFAYLRYLVVDEADRMSHIARIEWLSDLEAVARYDQTCATVDDLYNGNFLQKILVSATLSLDIEDLREWGLRHPRLFKAAKGDIVVTGESAANDVIVPSSLKIEYIMCDNKLKPLATYERIERRKSWKRVLIFVNSKMASFRLSLVLKMLSGNRYQVEEFSSNLFGNRRKKILARFRKGTTRVLISSDVMSRGIDVEDIDVVINYDKPLNARLFVHRVGRTARCGKKGIAISIITPKEVMVFIDALQISNCCQINVSLPFVTLKFFCELGIKYCTHIFQKKDFQKILQEVCFTGEVKEKKFDGVKHAETEELYRKALLNLKETLQSAQKVFL
ncbi:unnamed protein product [Thelazia callipaeda]|uniref:ATP-dependent RNA helicase n=1 Tax=Thelazia callipaeda TaxID=103827 RepID=A0A0N5CVJ8_THECL|nr:unnamed protein product [Thelazia callipaeda]